MAETKPASGAAAKTDQLGEAQRRLRRDRDGADDETLSSIDEADSSAWAIPYTDLTMLLLVFFVIALSQAGPPGATAVADDRTADWYAESLRAAPDCPEEAAASLAMVDGAAGVLPSGAALVGQRADGKAARADAGQRMEGEAGTAAGAGPRAGDEAKRAAADGQRAGGEVGRDEDAGRPADREAELAAEWARRVGELNALAASFLERNDLLDAVDLVKTETGVEFRMSDDILFRSGAATLEARGGDLIGRLAPLLRDIEGAIEVSGHTDDLPIRTVRFPSNWELSAARAIAVVRRLRDLGVPETEMKAVGYGPNRPVASNDDPAGRARNRRVTIGVAPRLPRG